MVELSEPHRTRYISLVLDAIPSGIAYCRLPDVGSPSGELCFLDVNAAFERIAGVRRNDAAGRCAWELFKHEGSGTGWPALIARLASGEAVRGLEHHIESVGQWLRVSTTPLPDRYIVVVVQDITAQKATERAVSERDERYRRMAEDAQDLIWWTDSEGTVLYVNPHSESLLGVPPAEAAGMAMTSYMSPESVERVRTWVRGARSADPRRDRFRGEVEYLHRDGRRIPGEINATLVRNAEGQVVAIEGITRDVSERRMLEEQLLQAQKMEGIGALAGGVAHDFNNILSVILSHVRFVLDDTEQHWQGRGDLEAIEEAAQQAETLTKQLLTFGRREFQALEVLDPCEVVGELQKLLGRVIPEHIEVASTLQGGTWRIRADRGQLEQMIMNLVVNSRDAMPDGGRITIETSNVELDEEYSRTHVGSKPGPHVRIAVSDTGCGMDEEMRSKVFEPFFTTKGQGRGSGLGLSTVYGIVKQNNGYIWVESEPGRGSTFEVFLPRSEVEGTRPKPRTDDPLALHGTETILIVEDEPSVRSVARRILVKRGYTVLEADNGVQALELAALHAGSIDLLLTDVIMPGMSGRELADKFLRLRPDTSVMYMSGYMDDALVRLSVVAQELPLLQKPFTPVSLTAKVRQILDADRR